MSPYAMKIIYGTNFIYRFLWNYLAFTFFLFLFCSEGFPLTEAIIFARKFLTSKTVIPRDNEHSLSKIK